MKAQEIRHEDRWDSVIIYWSSAERVDPLLVKAIIKAESGFKPQAVSKVGARGLMQVMPRTAVHVGVDPFWLHDPDVNLRAGIKYIREQIERFPEIPDRRERLKFALAAYNAGRGHINRAIAKAKKEGERWQNWKITKDYLRLITGEHSKETLLYVDRVMSFWIAYQLELKAARKART